MIITKERVPSPHPNIHLYETSYKSGALTVYGLLAEPTSRNKQPGLLYLRGGIKSVGMVRTQRVIQWAHEGFVVFAPYYRGNRGGEGREDFCGDDRVDAYSGFDLLSSHPLVEKEAGVHVVGFSRGGIMALWTGLMRPEATSIVCWSGVTDMVLTYKERVDLRRMMKRVIGGTPWKRPELYEKRTPLRHLSDFRPPLLFIHGKKDEHVSIVHAQKGLRAAKDSQNAESWFFADFSHHFPAEEQEKVLRKAATWMKAKHHSG
ncbi:peptidase [Niallia circulans]|uniref:alpha/beta hydrolase family protein n=1 Tax=Shouchella clausii TaxID=79880 RepID=UPI000BA75817|nr:prolyl oligopeptidase family serine peptidase [Shouchella clausii]MCM3547588.1 prolyl oligopeptidase family serine peptidase [Shouchella clausii]PAF16398.1 alpha/beta hydrolase [Shouchella clausii]SPT80636.1 peptidase [Niallia circulans]